MEVNKSTSAPSKKAKINEKAAKSAPAIAPHHKGVPAATPLASKVKNTNKVSRKRVNTTDDKDAAPDTKTPVPPLKKQRSDITHKPKPVRRTGIALFI